MITETIREFEAEQGVDSISQADIVNRLVQRLEVEEGSAGTSLERAEQTSRKIQNVINHMITKENVLMVTQDSKTNKNERLLCLNINNDIRM